MNARRVSINQNIFFKFVTFIATARHTKIQNGFATGAREVMRLSQRECISTTHRHTQQGRLVGCSVHDIWALNSRILQTFTLF